MKKKKIFNPYDERYKEKWYAMMEYQTYLYKQVSQVIIASGVVALYPNGPDQDAAIRERETQKALLLNHIGQYDTGLMELKKYYKETYNNLNECQTWSPDNFITSHKIVEYEYKNFYQK